jgi:Gram-negative bacterial TonB protein C-terminal
MKRALSAVAVFAFIAPILLSLQASPCSLQDTKNTDSAPRVVLAKLAPPEYAGIAMILGIAGDVVLQLLVRSDGSVESVKVMSGDLRLTLAATESAKKSRFDCRDCRGPYEITSLTYSFHPSPDKADPCCCSSAPIKEMQVVQSENHITITAPPLCLCPDECTIAAACAWAKAHKLRSAKCLYLWKCSTPHVSVQ